MSYLIYCHITLTTGDTIYFTSLLHATVHVGIYFLGMKRYYYPPPPPDAPGLGNTFMVIPNIPISYPETAIFRGRSRARGTRWHILVPRPKLGRPSQWPWFRLLSCLIVIGSFALKECCGWEQNAG